jgi:hypothetical protein
MPARWASVRARTGAFTPIASFWGLGPFTVGAITQTNQRQLIWALPLTPYWLDLSTNTLHQQCSPLWQVTPLVSRTHS